MGESIREPSDDVIDAVIAELDGPMDDEHPDVSLTHQSEWCLSAFSDGLLVWENVEDSGPPRHMTAVPRSEVRRLWAVLAQGNLDEIERQAWAPGYR